MDQEQLKQPQKRYKYACGCGYSTDKKSHFTKHANSYCSWPKNTRRRTSELPSFELQQPASDAEDAETQNARPEAPLDAQHPPFEGSDQQPPGHDHRVERSLQPHDRQGPGSPPPAAAAEAETEDAAAPPADPYQQFAEDIMAAAAEAGCSLEAERVWEFVQETRAAAGERQLQQARAGGAITCCLLYLSSP